MLATILIAVGLYIYYASFGWTYPPPLSIDLLWSAACLIAGLVILLKQQRPE